VIEVAEEGDAQARLYAYSSDNDRFHEIGKIPLEQTIFQASQKETEAQQKEISAQLRAKNARDEEFQFNALYTRLMEAKAKDVPGLVAGLSEADTRDVLARLDAAPGDNPAVRKAINALLTAKETPTETSELPNTQEIQAERDVKRLKELRAERTELIRQYGDKGQRHPQGWLIGGLNPAAQRLSGILLAFMALEKLGTSLSSLLSAAIAWRQIDSLFEAAARPDDGASPAWHTGERPLEERGTR
jgi:hypothetical protein